MNNKLSPSKPPARRMSGMTLSQWGIVLGLGLLCLVVAGWLAIRLFSSTAALPPGAPIATAELHAVLAVETPAPELALPTFPPEWTPTTVLSPTPTRPRSTATESPVPSATASRSPTEAGNTNPDATLEPVALYSFAGGETTRSEPFPLASGIYRITWVINAPDRAEFAVVLGSASMRSFINFGNGMGATSGEAEFEIASPANDFVLAVEAFGPWRVEIYRN